MEATRRSLESLWTADDRGGTGTGLEASLPATVAASDGDVLCDNGCSMHGEQRFIGETFSVAMLDCILSHTDTSHTVIGGLAVRRSTKKHAQIHTITVINLSINHHHLHHHHVLYFEKRLTDTT